MSQQNCPNVVFLKSDFAILFHESNLEQFRKNYVLQCKYS